MNASTMSYVRANTPPLPDYVPRDAVLALCAYVDRTGRADELLSIYNGDFTYSEISTRSKSLEEEAAALLTQHWNLHGHQQPALPVGAVFPSADDTQVIDSRAITTDTAACSCDPENGYSCDSQNCVERTPHAADPSAAPNTPDDLPF